MIGFLDPVWLWALPAAALPLLLHLVARRQPPTVPFPAVRYLQEVTREDRQRLKVRHWLLLLVRTLLILAVVLAAAGPTLARGGIGAHVPSALVLILDNSPSSGAVVGGTPIIERLRRAAAAVLDRGRADDAVWLMTADGVARQAPVPVLGRSLDSLTPVAVRLDLGAAVARARDLLAGAGRPAEIVLLSDLQRSALSPAEAGVPLLVGAPGAAPPPNLGIGLLDPGPQPWAPGDHRIRVRLLGDSGRTAPVILRSGSRSARAQLAGVDAPEGVAFAIPAPGWWVVTAALDPDEFRADDLRWTVVRVLPPAEARWSAGDRYLAAAAAALVEGGRLRVGTRVTLGWLGQGPSVVPPPADPAEVGSLNRALERRGVAWRFGGPVEREERSDSGALIGPIRVHRRLRLLATGAAPPGIDATVGGEPWIVHEGGVVLLGSRLDPAWTDAPSTAAFVPLVDALANRLVRGEASLLAGTPGAPVMMPDAVGEVTNGERRWRVEGGAPWRPPAPGAYFLLSGADTVGALAVNLDPRESDLASATAGEVETLWPGATLLPLTRVGAAAFGVGARRDVRGALLVLAVLLGLGEIGLASLRRGAA